MRRVIQALEQRAVKVAKSELDTLISSASQSIQIFVEDSTEVGEINKALRLFENITGILKVMQVHGGVLLAKETTDVVRGLVDGTIQRHEEAQDVISRAVMYLQDYLEHVEAGNKDIPLALMPVLNDLRASRDAALLSENVLFFPDLDGIEIPANESVNIEVDKAWINVLRAKYQKALLACINGNDVETAAAQMCKLCIRLQRNTTEVNAARLWWVSSAFAQSVAIAGIPFGASIISIFSSIDRKIKSLLDLGEKEFSKESHYSLIKNILYYIAIAEDRGRIVNKVKQAYLLNGQIPEIKELEKLREEIGGPSSNVLVAVSKAMLEDIASAKDCIELYIHSEFSEHEYIERLYAGLLKISDTLSMIGIDEYRDKIDVQIGEIELIKTGQEKDIDLSLLSVSEVILEIEKCINNFIEYRVNFRSYGHEAPNLSVEVNNHSNEHIEALSVTLSEALLVLEQTKELLSDVVHVNYEKEKCDYVIDNLETISGVIKMVDVCEAIPLIDGIIHYVGSEKFAEDIVSDNSLLHDLADCIVSLQCYFEQIELNVPNSQQILEYSELALSRLIAIGQELHEDVGNEDLIENNSGSIESFAFDETDNAAIEKELEVLPDLNDLMDFDSTDQIENANFTNDRISEYEIDSHINDPVESSEASELITIDESQGYQYVVLKEDADLEILSVFIEEANQVIDDVKSNWQAWLAEPNDWKYFVEMRRGFHTLKGSGRFSGAELLGEFAWALENLCNKIINKKSAVSSAARDLLQAAIDNTPALIDQLSEPEKAIDANVYELISIARQLAEMPQRKDENADEILDDRALDIDEVLSGEVASLDEESDDKILEKELTGIFSAEALKYLTVLQDAISIQADEDCKSLLTQEVIHTMHNLLGSSRTAGANAVYELCSPLENSLLYISSQNIKLSMQQSSLIRQGMEVLVFNLEQFINNEDNEVVDSELLHSIHALHEELLNRDSIIEQEDTKTEDNEVDVVDSIDLPVDLYSDVDEELCEIFTEEAEDSLLALQSSLQMLDAGERADEALSDMSRSLHTLKGSSRMAGFNTIGELSHITETLVLSIANKKTELSAEILVLLQKVVDAIHSSIERVQAKQDLRLDGELVSYVMSVCGLEVDEQEPSVDVHSIEQQQDKSDPHQELSQQVDEKESDSVAVNTQPFVLINEVHKSSSEEVIDAIAQEDIPLLSNPVDTLLIEPVENEKSEVIRVKADMLDELVNEAGEVSILNSQLQQILQTYSFSINEYEQTVTRLNEQLRKLEIETEAQILFKHASDQEKNINLDPLELDRYSDIQQLSRALSESADDLSNIKEMFQGHAQKWEDILNQQRIVSKHLQDSLLNTRMVKFLSVESRLHRTVRQTSSELDKDIDLVIIGANSDIDRSVLNRIVAPLEHLLRNSIFHGIESAEAREQAGKTKTGNIFIDVKRENAEIIISVGDDGAGINTERVRRIAVENGLINEHVSLSHDEILSLIFKPGFSTAKEVTQVAGRGVGMDIVDREIRNLGGSVSIESTLGKGVKFILKLPFTLAVSQALMVRAGKEVYALSLSGIEGIITLSVSELTKMGELDTPSYSYAGQQYAFYHLGSLLESGACEFDDDKASFPVLLVRVGDLRLALQLEESIGNREIVIKPIASKVMKMQGITGATILADGRVSLIIDTPWIAELVKANPEHIGSISQLMQPDTNKETTVMVVDDSITIRKVTTRFLERNHYKAVTAKDGVDALQKLQKMIPDLILLDIEMPRMDGYEMASQVQKDERLKDVPIIMITSRTGEKHRNLALDVGVKHYLGKPYNESELLKYIEDLQIGTQ